METEVCFDTVDDLSSKDGDSLEKQKCWQHHLYLLLLNLVMIMLLLLIVFQMVIIGI